MDRSRRTTHRRRQLGDSASPPSASEASFDLNLSTSPVVAHINTTPQSAHSGRRSSKPIQRAFTFSPPGPHRGLNLRKRSTIMDNYAIADDDEDGPKKGGHSLRKRARVDYTFEHIEDDVTVPNSSSSARGRKRRPDVNFDTEDFYGTDAKRRGASMGADTPSTRRRNPSRKTSEMKAYREPFEDDDNDVQDTIEVGISYSDVDESEIHEPSFSNNSSPHSVKTPAMSDQEAPPASKEPSNIQSRPSIEDSSEVPRAPPQATLDHYFTKTPREKSASQPAEQVQGEPAKVETTVQPSSSVPHTPPPTTNTAVSTDTSAATDADAASNTVAASEAVAASDVVATAATVATSATIATSDTNATSSVADVTDAVAASDAIDTTDAVDATDTVATSGIVASPEPVAASDVAATDADASSDVVASGAVAPDVVALDVVAPDVVAASDVLAAPEILAAPDIVGNAPSLITAESSVGESTPAPIETQVNSEPIASPKNNTEDCAEPSNNIKREAEEDVEEESKEESTKIIRASTPQDSQINQNNRSNQVQGSNENKEDDQEGVEDEMDIDSVEETIQDIEMADPEPKTQIPGQGSSPPPLIPEITNDVPVSPEVNSTDLVQGASETKEEHTANDPLNSADPLPDKVQSSSSPQHIVTKEALVPMPSPKEVEAPTPTSSAETRESLSVQPEPKPSPRKAATPRPIMTKPQPTPIGRWSHLTPYVDGEFVSYPEKKGRLEEDIAAEEPTSEGKDTDREGIDMEPMVEDNDDNLDTAAPEAPTPALNTPTRGSPVPDSTDPTAFNSPAPAGEDADEADVSESQEPPDRRRYFKYRKLRDPEEYISAVENFEDMSTADLYEVLEAINVSLGQWQQEWTGLGRVVDDYENALRRRAADAKYESRTRNLHQHGVNYEEPDFGVKGYKAKEKEGMTETRYLQGQDRIMAATYGFEYDPHPSKIGRQNPETQQVGIMTRGRSLRNQPRQTAKASETDEVTGKRQRKPVQLFDPAAVQDISRSSTPVPTRGRRRKNANGDGEDTQSNPNASFNAEIPSDGEGALQKTRRRRGPRAKGAVPSIVEEFNPGQDEDESTYNEELTKPSRRGRGRPAIRYEEADPNEFVEDEPQPELKQPRRHLLTLKIPKGRNLSEPSSAITDNGESRPSTASSEESSHTAESSYSFRPKRQKRFRDDPDGSEEVAQAPPKKRGKRISGVMAVNDGPPPTSVGPTSEPSQTPNNRKVQKIKVVRSGPDVVRNGAPPASEEGEEPPKDYKSMTKSEKMSASMKNRWANGNMAGAVEKRKATLAAKKAAQAAADQKLGVIAPKLKGKAALKKEAALHLQHQHQPHQHQQQHQHQHQQQLHLQHQQQQQQQHPQQQLHQQRPQHPPHQGGNPGYVHGMPNMGYPYQQM